jgi:hypothetical protein
MNISEEEGVMTCFFRHEEQKEKKRRRFWVHNIRKKMKIHGEFHLLFPDYQKVREIFVKYFRMTYGKFRAMNFLDILGSNLLRESTLNLPVSHQ